MMLFNYFKINDMKCFDYHHKNYQGNIEKIHGIYYGTFYSNQKNYPYNKLCYITATTGLYKWETCFNLIKQRNGTILFKFNDTLCENCKNKIIEYKLMGN